MYYEDIIEGNEPLSGVYNGNETVTATFKKSVVDKNCEMYSIKTPYFKKAKNGKHYRVIEDVYNFGSGQHGTKIRNAVTGEKYPFLVGSVNEDLFFKVSEVTGRNRRNSTLTLFYDSPEQYEKHHYTTVSQGVKDKWHEKNLMARRREKLIV